MLLLSRLYICMDMCCHEIAGVGLECGWFNPYAHISEVSCVASLDAAVCVDGSGQVVEEDELISIKITLVALNMHRRTMEIVLHEGLSGFRSCFDSRIRFPWLQDKHCDVSRSGAATLTAYASCPKC